MEDRIDEFIKIKNELLMNSVDILSDLSKQKDVDYLKKI
jgi:hypothetical protein